MTSALKAILGLRRGEAGLFSLIFAHAFACGIPQAFTPAAGAALFLEQYGAEMLPWAYLSAAAIVPASMWGLLRLQRALSFPAFLRLVLGVTIVLDTGAWAAAAWFQAPAVTAALPVWIELQYALLTFELWALAGRVLDVQQAKRLFGAIAAGTVSGTGLAGVLTPWIVSRTGTASLLLLSGIASFVGLALLHRIAREYGSRLDTREDRCERGAAAIPADPLARRYVRGIYGIVGCSLAAYYLVERVFLQSAAIALPDSQALASFLGVVFAVSALVSLLSQTFVTPRILARFGPGGGLLVLPAFVLTKSVVAAAVGWTIGVGPLLLWLVMVARGCDRVLREALDGPSGLLLYQPLGASVRVRVQGQAESIVGPLAGGAASLGVIGLQHAGVDGIADLSAATAIVAAAWCVVAYGQRRAYRTMVAHALADRTAAPMALAYDDPAARAALLRAVRAPWLGEALWALDALWRVSPRSASAEIAAMLEHPSSSARDAALRRAGEHGSVDLLEQVRALADDDPEPAVRASALRTLVALGDPGAGARLRSAAGDPEPLLRAEALVERLRGSRPADASAARLEVADLAQSPDPEQRVLAAMVLARSAEAEFAPILARLAMDPQGRVRRTARSACERAGPAPIPALVIESLGRADLHDSAMRAAAGTPGAVRELLERLVAPPESKRSRLRAIRALVRIGGREVAPNLSNALADADPQVRDAALAGLFACRWRATAAHAETLLAWWRHEASAVIDLRDSIADVRDEAGSLVARALACDLRRRRGRLLLLLGLFVGPDRVHVAKERYETGGPRRRALALEVLGSLLPAKLRAEGLLALDDSEGGGTLSAPARLAEIVGSGANGAGWTRACALHAIGRAGRAEMRDLVAAAFAESELVVRETAAWALARLDGSEGGGQMLTIEKVLILKSALLFEETADDVLADVASLLRVVDVGEGERVVVKGDVGDALYLVEHGALSVHDGEREFARLGPRDVFGELAVLDPESRSASVTALEPSRLLRLDGADLYELMSDRIEVARGIIRVLCRRLRETWHRRELDGHELRSGGSRAEGTERAPVEGANPRS